MNATLDSVSRVTRIIADLLRVAVLVGVVVTAMSDEVEGTVRLALVLVILLAVRIAKVPGPFDLSVGLLLSTAAVALMTDLYSQLPWLDWVLHCLTTGAVAAAAFLVSVRVGMLPRPPAPRGATTVLMTTTLGVTLGVLWEFYEWFAQVVIGIQIGVGYDDTIADLAMDMAGSLLAGFAVLLWTGTEQRRDAETTSGDR